MTQQEWLNPDLTTVAGPLSGMLEELDGRISSRQIGLFLLACARRAKYRFPQIREQFTVGQLRKDIFSP
jgi:hypothetical protein